MHYEKISRGQLEKEIIEFLDSTCCLPDPNPGPHGCGTLITIRSDKKTYMENVEKWNMREVAKKLMSPLIKNLVPEEQEKEVEKILGALNLIRLEPTRMVLRTYNPDFSMPKHEWEKE